MNSAPMIVHSFTSGSSSYFLATRAGSDAGDPIKLTLCDGTSAWTGQIQAADLKPPKNCSAEDFRRRLLQGLCGAETANNSTVAVARSTRDADDAELRWSATKTLDDLGIDIRLQHTAKLTADILPGTGLCGLLGELVGECARLETTVKERDAHASALDAQLDELNGVVADRLETSQNAVTADFRLGHFLKLINEKKRRISELDIKIDRVDQGGDMFGDLISNRGSDDGGGDIFDEVEGGDADDDGATIVGHGWNTAGGGGSSSAAAKAPSPARKGNGKQPRVEKPAQTVDLFAQLDDDDD